MSSASLIDYGVNRKGNRQTRRQWLTEGPPRALVLLIHGIAEHSGRYEAVGAQFAAAGIGAVAIDQRGHGTTEGTKGHVESFEGFLDDVEDQIAQLRSAGVPVILLGHSMGGLIATAYAVSDRPSPDLLVLSGPALGTDLPGWQQTAIAKFAQLSPKLFLGPPFDTAVLSRNPQVGHDYNADPLIKPGGSANLLAGLMDTMHATAARVDELSIPTLCLHGADDELVPTAGSEVLEGVPGVERRVLPHLRHEIFNEPEGDEILASVIEWIDGQLQVS
jgi:alpha-beta hydrolase superfamily lysophospholipase